MNGIIGPNITSYLLGTNKTGNVKSPSTNGTTSGTAMNANVKPIVSSSILRIIAYFLAIVIIIFVILLFIHFFIKPIFRLRPGTPGIIPVPGFDDGKLYWSTTSPGQILNKDLPISNQVYNYSLNIDVFVQNPLQFSKMPRLIFSRGAILKEHPEGDTLLGILNQYNLAVALLPDTNDLLVSVLNKDNNMENIIVPNIPVQQPFRLGIIIMEQALEVYISGHLIKTRTFYSPPMDVKGDIYPASGIEANIALLRNLKIWPRILTTNEIRYATPSLSSLQNFGASPIPSSTSNASTSINSVKNAMERYDKLSVNSIVP